MGRKITDQPKITETHADKVKYWDYSANGKLKPKDFTYNSNEQIWWICPHDSNHRWFQSVTVFCRRQADCLFCSRRQVPEHLKLATKHPALSKEWHPSLNGHLTPQNVIVSSSRTAWWQCAANKKHQWCASIRSRIFDGEGCPFCDKSRLKIKDSLAAANPELAGWWSDENPADLSPRNIAARSSFVASWKCSYTGTRTGEGHIWKARIIDMVDRGAVCPGCNRESNQPSTSLAKGYPRIAAQWHPTKNGDLTPHDVSCGSARLVWWSCDVAEDHQWRLSVGVRTAKETECPFCAKRHISSTNSLERLFPEVAAQWDKKRNGKAKPSEVPPTSQHKYWWQCSISADHVWKSSPSDRTAQGTGCPYCANQAVCSTNNLAHLFPEVAEEWHPTKNGKLKPEQIVYGYSKKIWWQCRINNDHCWSATGFSRTTNGTGCPLCLTLRAPKEESLKALFPKVSREWHPTKIAI